MKPGLIGAIGLMLIGVPSAHGRLGETYDQCVKRYGLPTSKEVFGNRMTANFGVDAMQITCLFTDQECRGLYYALMPISRVIQSPKEHGFTLEQQVTLRDLNKGDSIWVPIEDPGYGKKFKSADGTKLASISEDRVIVETTKGMREREAMVEEKAVNELIKKL